MDFSLQIVKEALRISNENGENFVSSPLSIAALLQILAVGSSGRTLQEFHHLFGTQTLDDIKSNYSKFALISAPAKRSSGSDQSDLSSDNSMEKKNDKAVDKVKADPPILNFVNGVWVNKYHAISPSFKEILHSTFKAETKSLDLVYKLDESIKEVNSWVEKATKGFINNILDHSNVNESTIIILANALYFKGTWERKFVPDQTISLKERCFHLINGEKVVVPFMRGNMSRDYHYRSLDTFDVVKVPYENGGDDDQRKFSMHLFLPNKIDGLPEMLKEFNDNPSLFLNVKLEPEDLEALVIPKFEISYKSQITELVNCLGLGLDDLTEMIEHHGAKVENIQVFHKARILVDEERTEAAAVTYATDEYLCMYPFIYRPRKSFVADHPFMFMIREDTSETPFFVGVVHNPLRKK